MNRGCAAIGGSLGLDQLIVYAQAAVGTRMSAFGGRNWALDGAAAPVAAVLRLEPAMPQAGGLVVGRRSAAGMPAHPVGAVDRCLYMSQPISS